MEKSGLITPEKDARQPMVGCSHSSFEPHRQAASGDKFKGSNNLGKRNDDFKFEPPEVPPLWNKTQIYSKDFLIRNMVNSNDKYFRWLSSSQAHTSDSARATRTASGNSLTANPKINNQKSLYELDEVTTTCNVPSKPSKSWTKPEVARRWHDVLLPPTNSATPPQQTYSLRQFAVSGTFHDLPFSIDEMVSHAPINHMSVKYLRSDGAIDFCSLMISQASLRTSLSPVPPEVRPHITKQTIRKKAKVQMAKNRANPLVDDIINEDEAGVSNSHKTEHSSQGLSSEVVAEELEDIIDKARRYFEPTIICSLCREIGHRSDKCYLRFRNSECRNCLGSHNKGKCDQHACTRCKQDGHHMALCPYQLEHLNASAAFCTYCKYFGHHDRDCRVLSSKKHKIVDVLERLCSVCCLPGHLESTHPVDPELPKMLI